MIDLANIRFRTYIHEELEEEEEEFIYPVFDNKPDIAASSTTPIDLSAIKFRAQQDPEQDPEFEEGEEE